MRYYTNQEMNIGRHTLQLDSRLDGARAGTTVYTVAQPPTSELPNLRQHRFEGRSQSSSRNNSVERGHQVYKNQRFRSTERRPLI